LDNAGGLINEGKIPALSGVGGWVGWSAGLIQFMWGRVGQPAQPGENNSTFNHLGEIGSEQKLTAFSEKTV
jgi:hypothetical protein